jgi:hypothetical protein
MKKVTILMAALISVGGVASAQRISQMSQLAGSLTAASDFTAPTSAKNVKNTARAAAASFYTEDFSTGLTNWTQNGVPLATAKWEYRSMQAADTLGSRGAYNGVRRHMISATTANGFIIFDSDYLDNGGVAGAFGKGSSPAPHTGVLTSPVINCSSHPAVIMNFTQYFRRFNASGTKIKVSNGTKDSLYVVNKIDPTSNNETARNSQVQLNISDIAGGQSTVNISFVFDGTGGPAGSQGYYFWQIDDVSLQDPTPGDLAIEVDNMTNYYNNGLQTQVPVKQLSKGFNFYAKTYNFSGSTIANTQVTATITNTTGGANTNIATLVSPAKTMLSFERDSIGLRDSTIALPGKGDYTGVVSISSPTPDGDLTNNTIRTYRLSVGDSTFSRDMGSATTIVGPGNFTGGNAAGSGILNEYTIQKTDTVSSISVYLGKTSVIGTAYEVQLLDTALKILSASDIQTVSAGQPGNFVRILLDKSGAITPNAGRIVKPGTYYVKVYCYAQDQTTTPKQFISFGDDASFPQPNGTSLLTIGTTLYNNGNAWLLRMNMQRYPEVGLSTLTQNGVSLSQNVPNPFTGNSTINYEIASAAKVTLEVTDITGRKVAEYNEGVKTAGSYQIGLNAKDFNKGIYFYTLRVGENSLTKKMIISE